jgi:tetratricopeptide (TPR) repeat protein
MRGRIPFPLRGEPVIALILIVHFLLASALPAAEKPRAPEIIGQAGALQKGLTALKENHFDQAVEAFTLAEKEQPEDARIRNFRGIALAQLGKTTDAEAEYREAIRLDPKYEDAWRNLGFLLWTEHRQDQAGEVLLQAIALSPDDAFSHYYLGRVLLETQQYEDAFRELKMSRLPWPDDPGFLIQATRGYLALGSQEEAHGVLRQLSTQNLNTVQSAQVASLFLSARDYAPAIELLKAASDYGGRDEAAWAQFDLALTFLLSGNYEQASQQSQSLADSERTKKLGVKEAAAAWSLLGIAQARLGHVDPAVHALRQAANLEPQNEEHWLNLTRELMEANRYAEAISAAQGGIRSNANSYALHLRLGAAQLAAGQYKEAEAAFRTLVDAGDPLPTSYVGLAQVLLRGGLPEDAVTVLAAAEQKIGKNFLLSYFLGLSLDRAGKRQEATNAFREAIRQNPGSSEAHLGLGKSQLALGQVNEAIAELLEALRLGPGNVQARRLLSQAYRRIGDTNHAEEFAQASSEEPPAAEGDLLGDFLLPKWQMPAEGQSRGSAPGTDAS